MDSDHDLVGNEAARAAFRAAADSGALPHAWLFAGPQGLGKASFAEAAALRLLAEGTGEHGLTGAFDVPADSATRRLIEAGSHPDYRVLRRLPKDADKPDQDLARNIPIAQVRALHPLFATTPSMSSRRAIIIDAIDDLEREAANALLKVLEEPPAGTIFLLVSHAPGRLLPTIRSRCRLLRFDPLPAAAMTSWLANALPALPESERAALAAASGGAPGRALALAQLQIGAIEAALGAIAQGDRGGRHRAELIRQLSGKAAQPRYEAFLERAPSFIADQARHATGPMLAQAVDAYAAARALAGAARGLSLDTAGTVFEMAGIVARLAPRDAR